VREEKREKGSTGSAALVWGGKMARSLTLGVLLRSTRGQIPSLLRSEEERRGPFSRG